MRRFLQGEEDSLPVEADAAGDVGLLILLHNNILCCDYSLLSLLLLCLWGVESNEDWL